MRKMDPACCYGLCAVRKWIGKPTRLSVTQRPDVTSANKFAASDAFAFEQRENIRADGAFQCMQCKRGDSGDQEERR